MPQGSTAQVSGLPPPQDYLIFHPKRTGYVAAGVAVVVGAPVPAWKGTVWTDPWHRNAGSNEDPYVWNSEWLYSYCHASQLRRAQNKTQSRVREGSRIFFCETPAAKLGVLKVDTVFVVSDVAPWVARGLTVPARFSAHQVVGQGPIWDRHLRHGVAGAGSGSHKGLYTYVAHLGGASYLPLGADGKPTCLPIESVLPGRAVALQKALPAKQTTRPMPLTKGESAQLDAALVASSHTRVVQLTSPQPIGPTNLK